MKIDVGKLTEEETQELLGQCIGYLRWDTLAGTLTAYLTSEQKQELAEIWSLAQ